jgi:xanthine/uracil permease
MGLQHALAMFGSTVVVPVVTGFDPDVVIFFSGVGSLIVSGRISSYLGSSCSFVAPVAAVIGSPAAGTLNTASARISSSSLIRGSRTPR